MYQQENESKNQHLENFWNFFFKDKYKDALNEIAQIEELNEASSAELVHELKSKVFLRQGEFQKALSETQHISANRGIRLFIEFLCLGDPKKILCSNEIDTDTLLYKSQALLLTKIYWGEDYLDAIGAKDSPDKLLEEVFGRLLDQGDVDKAILAAIQSLELMLEDQLLSHDIHLPIIHEHLENLLELSAKTKYNSTKAKLFLIKARIFGNREDAGDAEILFGKENNLTGLGEVYFTYAKDFGDEQYYATALRAFIDSENYIACGFIHEALASNALVSGNVQDAKKEFEKAENYLNRGGIFEKYGLEIQRISLMAISGKYLKVKEAVHNLIDQQPPPFFVAQAYQILANTLVQLGDDLELAKGYIEAACDIFYRLRRYNQLLYTRNVHFQILLLQNDLALINQVGQEIIQLATRLGNEEIKASKYLDLAFITIRISLEEGNLDENKISEAGEFFKKAIKLYQEQGNLIGEADTYQAMGNMYTGIGKLEEALNAFLNAKKLYQSEKAFLQSAITDTLIGILMLNYVVLNDQTYPIAHRHLEQALVYFSKENLLDLSWKAHFYIADLNHKYFVINKDNSNSELYKNKASKFYSDMYCVIKDFQDDVEPITNQVNFVGITVEDALNKAYQFFLTIGENEQAKKFRPYNNN